MLLASILMASALALGNCEANFAAYKATYTGERQFKIEAEFVTSQTEFLLGHNPTDNRPEGQAKSIRELTAFDAAGKEIEISYKGEGAWNVQEGAARITYQIVVDHDQVEWPYGADEVGHPFGGGYYFAGTTFFVGPYAQPTTCPVQVTFDVPEGWTLTAPWATGGLEGLAQSIVDLGDNGFAIGPFLPSTQKVGGLTLNSVYDIRLAKDVQPYVSSLLDVLLPAYTDYFGGAPAANYSTFHFGYASSDGSAFSRSFTMQYEYPLNLVERPLWAHGLAHETMHLWTGVVERVDHEIEWFTEGFTDYLAIKHLYREGYLDDEGLRSELAGLVTRHQLGKRMSQGTSLRDAGANKGQNWFLIYGSGALIALILDADMSTTEPGSFDAMMAELYGQGEQPYDFERLIEFLNAHSNGRAIEVFNAVDGGLRPNEINRQLSPAGIGVAGMLDRTFISFEGNCRKSKGCAPKFLN